MESDVWPLTVDNVVKVLQQVPVDTESLIHWRDVSAMILWISGDKLDEIMSDCASEHECLVEAVSFWLKSCPYASWRYIIWQLEDDERRLLIADKIRHRVRPLKDHSLTIANVAAVLKSVSSFDSVDYCLKVPRAKRQEIWKEGNKYNQHRVALIAHWVNYSPFAGWSELAGELFYLEERKALRQLTEHHLKVKVQKDPTLTYDNLLHHVDNWGLLRNGIPWRLLNISDLAVYNKASRFYDDRTKYMSVLIQYFLDSHPAPSWKLVAHAVYYKAGCVPLRDKPMETDWYKKLESIQTNFLRKTPSLQELCTDMLSTILDNKQDVDSLPLPNRIKTLIKMKYFSCSTALYT